MLRHMRPVTKLLILGGFLTFLLTLYSLHPSSTRLRQSVSGVFSFRERKPCSPELWSDGQWTRRIPPHSTKANASNVADVLEFHGFEGCASDREYKWHLGADDSELSRYPDVSSWQWTPPSRCNARPFVKEEVVQDLVENGGWFLVGGEFSCSIPRFFTFGVFLPRISVSLPQSFVAADPIMHSLNISNACVIMRAPSFKRQVVLHSSPYCQYPQPMLGSRLFCGTGGWRHVLEPAYDGLLMEWLSESDYALLSKNVLLPSLIWLVTASPPRSQS